MVGIRKCEFGLLKRRLILLTLKYFLQNTLYYRRVSKRNFENVDVVDVNTLKITSRTQFILPSAKEICNVIFSDGEALNIICTKDVS